MNSGSASPARVDAEQILGKALGGLQGMPDGLVDALLAELGKPDTNRIQRLEDAFKGAADDRTD
jgi:hypothetical protein